MGAKLNQWLLPVFAVCLISTVYGDPQGCTYDSKELLFTCNARSWSLPMTFAQFTTAQPQRILLREVDGELPNGSPNGPTFSGFSSINTALFDTNYAPALYIRCTANGQLLITQGTFTDFGWIEEFVIEDCDILSLPANVFTNIGNLNYFGVIGGSIKVMVGDSFTGMNVEKRSTVPNPRGEMEFRNTQLVEGGFASGALFSQTKVSRLIVENANLRVIQTDMFYALKQLTYLDISYNPYMYIPEDLFKGVNSLTTVSMYGIDWACTCTNLWFLSWFTSNNVTLHGDIVCASPSAYENVKMAIFNSEQCDDSTPCTGKTGIVVGSTCLTMFDMINYALLLVTFVMSLIALGLIIHTKRQVGNAKDAKQGGGDKKAGGGLRRASASFNKVQDAMMAKKPKA